MTFSFTILENGLRIKIQSNIASIASIEKTINFDDNEPFDKTIRDMIDNMRMTVKEREWALVDFNMFKEYLCNFADKKNKEIVINEQKDI